MKKLRTAAFNKAAKRLSEALERDALESFCRSFQPKNRPYKWGAILDYNERVIRNCGMDYWINREHKLRKKPGHPVLTTR